MIESRKDLGFGMPILQGRRITVHDVIERIELEGLEDSMKELQVTHIQIREALKYCMDQMCKNAIQFCDGCLLRTLKEGRNLDIRSMLEVKEDNNVYTISHDSKVIFLGTREEFENSEFGDLAWLAAERFYKEYFG